MSAPTDTLDRSLRPAPTSTGPAPRRPKIRKHRRRTTVRLTVLTVVLIPVCLTWVYPFIWMVSASLKSNKEIYAGLNPFPAIIRLDNYVRAWQQANIGHYFFNTVFITFFSIIIAVTSTALIGYVLGRYRFAGKKAVIGLFAAAVFLPEGYTIIPIFDLISTMHLSGSLWGVTLAEAGGAHIVATLLFAGYFRQLPNELEESARMDGAGFLRIFVSVYLPNDWAGMAAASTISLMPIIIVFLFLQRYFVESIAGALKN